MADPPEDKLWLLLYGVFAINSAWKSYLELRNIRATERPSTPHPVLGLGVTYYDHIRSLIHRRSCWYLMSFIADFWVCSLKFHSNYYSYVWKLTEVLRNTTVRSIAFVMLDGAIGLCMHLFATRNTLFSSPSFLVQPSTVVRIRYEKENQLMLVLIEVLIRILILRLFGPAGAFVLVNVVAGLFIGTIQIVFMFDPYLGGQSPRQSRHSHLTDDELGTAVKSLATRVGYPTYRIFMLDTACCPDAYYHHCVFWNWITIHSSIKAVLDTPEIVSTFARAVCKWKYCHPYYKYAMAILADATLYLIMAVPCGNPRVLQVFGLEDVHPVVGDILISQFILIPFLISMLPGCVSVLNTYLETRADDYACRVSDPRNVRDSVLKLYDYGDQPAGKWSWAGTDSWYATWYYGYPDPPIVERLTRLESRISN